jgi:hypothetical protein
MNISQKQMSKLIYYVETYSRYKELYSIELCKDKPNWKIVEDRLDMAYSYGQMIIRILEGTGIDPNKVADGITYFVKLYKDEMDAKEAA